MKSEDRSDALILFKRAREKLKSMESELRNLTTDVDWLISVLEGSKVRGNDESRV